MIAPLICVLVIALVVVYVQDRQCDRLWSELKEVRIERRAILAKWLGPIDAAEIAADDAAIAAAHTKRDDKPRSVRELLSFARRKDRRAA